MRLAYAFAATAAMLAAAPLAAKEWSKDKAWTVTEFNDGACLMRFSDGGATFQVIEALDHHGGLSASGLPGIGSAEGKLSYGFSNENYMTVLAMRAASYLTETHNSIDTILWALPAHPATLAGKPAFEAEMPRNFLALLAAHSKLMLSTEDKPQVEGFFDMQGAGVAVGALRNCNDALRTKAAKGGK